MSADLAPPAFVLLRIEQGATIDEIAIELEITPRHVRRLAKAGGWTPSPRKHTGPRTIKVTISAETYQALKARHDLNDALRGRRVEDTAAALLGAVADKTKLANEREVAARSDAHGSAWAAGYLDALVARIERVR